eukprot:1157682-Pelagomonas_calceolata.AAC.5
MAVVSMGGVGAAAAAAAAWPPSAEQAAQAAGSDTNAAAASANANSNAATVATANLSSRPSLDLSRPIQMNIPQESTKPYLHFNNRLAVATKQRNPYVCNLDCSSYALIIHMGVKDDLFTIKIWQALLVQEHAGYKRLFLSREVFMHTSPRIPPIDPFFSAMMSDMEFLYAQELHQMLDLNP